MSTVWTQRPLSILAVDNLGESWHARGSGRTEERCNSLDSLTQEGSINRFTWWRIVQRRCPCRDAENRDRENWEHIATWTTRLRQLTGGRRSSRRVARQRTNACATKRAAPSGKYHEISVYNCPVDGEDTNASLRYERERRPGASHFHANYITPVITLTISLSILSSLSRSDWLES